MAATPRQGRRPQKVSHALPDRLDFVTVPGREADEARTFGDPGLIVGADLGIDRALRLRQQPPDRVLVFRFVGQVGGLRGSLARS